MKNTASDPVYVKVVPSKGIAFILSFLIPGLGQLYQGRIGAGVLLFFMAIVLGCVLPILGAIIVWGISLLDTLSYNPK